MKRITVCFFTLLLIGCGLLMFQTATGRSRDDSEIILGFLKALDGRGLERYLNANSFDKVDTIMPKVWAEAITFDAEGTEHVLIEHGHVPPKGWPKGFLPVQIAMSIGGYNEAVKVLARNGFDLQVKDKKVGMTCLTSAARAGNADLVAFLLKHGADPNLVGPNGNSALRLALCARGGVDRLSATLLVAAGAKTSVLNNRGSPVWKSMSDGQSEEARKLVEWYQTMPKWETTIGNHGRAGSSSVP